MGSRTGTETSSPVSRCCLCSRQIGAIYTAKTQTDSTVYTVNTVYTDSTVYTVNTVYTQSTVYTVNTPTQLTYVMSVQFYATTRFV